MHLYDEGETEGQARFFSPTKVARARERTAAAEEAQLQHQRLVRDKKLQTTITRAEKARDTDERKQQRQLLRQAAREQIAIEKAERQAVREARRAEKATEAAKRKRQAEERRTERVRAKEAKVAAVQSKKRSLEEDVVEQPRKRVRTNASRVRSAATSHVSSIELDTRTVQDSARTISRTDLNRSGYNTPDLSEGLILTSQRSGRAVRLPTRFR